MGMNSAPKPRPTIATRTFFCEAMRRSLVFRGLAQRSTARLSPLWCPGVDAWCRSGLRIGARFGEGKSFPGLPLVARGSSESGRLLLSEGLRHRLLLEALGRFALGGVLIQGADENALQGGGNGADHEQPED